MGQGHYRLLGIGCLNPMDYIDPQPSDSEKLDAIVEAAEPKGMRLQTAYEAEPDYLCILFALDNPNARTGGEKLSIFSPSTIPDLLRAAAPTNPHLDLPALLAEFEQRPVLSRQIAELSARSNAHLRKGEFEEFKRLQDQAFVLHRKTTSWHRFACTLPALPQSVAAQIPAAAIETARAAWDAVRQIAKHDFGVTLPTGSLVFADDWD